MAGGGELIGLVGDPLQPRDYEALAARWIDRAAADQSLFRRVCSVAGSELVGRNGNGDYSGIALPYVIPGAERVREYRLKRDHPEFENGKAKNRYMSPPGRGNLLYFPLGTAAAWLSDVSLPLVITEGEFKTVALFRAAYHEISDAADAPRFLPIGLSGVWNWRGVVGKRIDETGARVDEKGVIADLSLIAFSGRTVTILFDRDIETNGKIEIARSMLARELRSRGALVKYFRWPAAAIEAKGVDDLLAAIGPDDVLSLIDAAPEASTSPARACSVNDIPSIRTFAAKKIDFAIEGIIAAGAVTAITGDAGSGKSTFVTALCGAVRAGERFAGLLTQKRPVLMLDRDNSLPSVIERFERLRIEDGDDFTVWGGWNETEAPLPSSPIVADYVRSCAPVAPLIVIDCLAAFLEGDENDAATVRNFMQGLRRLADLGSPVVILHHSGKGETTRDYRGSSDFKASIDVGFALTNLGDSTRLVRIKLKAFKSRFVVEGDLLLHYLDGRFRLDDRPAARTNDEALRDLLIANPGITTKRYEDLAVEKNLGRGRARAFIEAGLVAGKITKTKVQNARYFTWCGDSPEIELFP